MVCLGAIPWNFNEITLGARRGATKWPTCKADIRARIIIDAAVRRFQCQRAYLRAHAGLRWMNTRSSILRGQNPNASHFTALQGADSNLRMVSRHSGIDSITKTIHPYHPTTILTRRSQELLAITDEYVDNTLRAKDASQRKWLAEDPSLTQIQQILMRR